MFRNEMKFLFSDLSEKFPELTKEERECMSNRESPILREGVRVIPTGGQSGKGRIIITKTIDANTVVSDEIWEICKKIRFPCHLRIDGNGFLENKKGDIIFLFRKSKYGSYSQF